MVTTETPRHTWLPSLAAAFAVRNAFAERGKSTIPQNRSVRQSGRPEVSQVRKSLARIDINRDGIANVHLADRYASPHQRILVGPLHIKRRSAAARLGNFEGDL